MSAHLSARDPRHAEASDYLRGSGAQDFLMHSLNLADVLVAGARVGRDEEMLDDLRAIGVRVTDRPENEALRLARLRAQSGLTLPHCCALDTALFTGTSLATFDRALASAARARGLTVVPESRTRGRTARG